MSVFSEKTISITLYPGVVTKSGFDYGTSWKGLIHHFSVDRPIVSKSENNGFGPYALTAPEEPCLRHGLVPIDTPHRCDACVREVTLAVFDMDRGTHEDVAACTDRLEAEGVSHFVYSTHSYRPEQDRPALRLVVQLDKPVPSARWKTWRLGFMLRFSIPADKDKCQAPSHFYYAPAHPPGVVPVFVSFEGRPFPTDEIPTKETSYIAANPTPEVGADFAPMPPEKLEEWRRLLEKKARRLAKGRPEEREKGEILRRLLAGEALAEHGHRNQTSTRAAALILAAWHEGTVGGALEIMRPSLEAMRAEGSKLDEGTLGRQLASAFAKVTASRAERARLDAELEALFFASA